MIKPIIMISLLFFSACSVKEYRLFQHENSEHISETQELNISYTSKIVPNDVLEIDIYNMNKKSNIMMPTNGSIVLPDNKYVVYADGSIILPLLNVVQVEGYTLKEMNEVLLDRYREFLKAPYVKVSVKNHKVYVLGEVAKQGVIAMEGESISLIEVIAKAGGLTDHAIRNRIRVISEDRGKHTLRTLNLNQFSTLSTKNMMLKHNSIVYIEPKSTKEIRVAINDYLPIIQAASSILSTFLTIEVLKDK
jgi:polysaccharide export outer membrane protein